jgi:tetratricopeptide (TPR) repeat protein
MTWLFDWFPRFRQTAASCFQKGLESLDENDFDLAISWFNACIHHDPSRPAGFYGRGFARLKKEEYDGAIADLSEAIRLGPDNAYSYYYRSLCYRAKGRESLEGADLERASRLGARLDGASGDNERTSEPDDVVMALCAAMREMTQHEFDGTVRSLASKAITQFSAQAPTNVSALLAALHHKEPTIRFGAAHSLGDLGEAGRPALDSLKQALLDRDLGVRVQAARAVWLIDGQIEVPISILIEAVAGDDEILRWIAADCLGEIGPRAATAIPTLEKALQANFEITHVRTGLSIAIDRIRGKAVDPDFH